MDTLRNAAALPRHLRPGATARRVAVATVAAVALAGATGVAQAAPGALDPTFGTGGIVLADPGSVMFQGLAVQPDGKVLALDAGNDSQAYERVLRFLPDGTPDPSFGNGGAAEPVASPAFWTRALALQPDGKIVVAGYDSAHDYVVARLLPDGKLDPDFDGDTGTANGIVHTVLTPGNDMPRSAQVDKQGRIVVAGSAGGSDVGIVRYLPDGKLDKSFAGDGTMVDVTPAAETVAAMATVDNGIVVAGSISSTTLVARYTDAGAVATGFAQSGRAVVDADPANSDAADSLAVQSDGTILVGVSTWSASTSPPDRLVALTPGGALDTGFANGGNTPVQINLYALAVASDDRIVTAGWGILNDDDAFALQRLNTDGTPDTSFAGGAPVLTRPPNAYAIADEAAVAPDGKVVLAGEAYDNGSGATHLAIARYQVAADPALDPGSTDAGGGTQPVAQQPDPLALSGLIVTHRTFSTGRRSTRTVGRAQAARSPRRGTAFVFRLNRAATVIIRIKRLHHAGTIVKLKRTSSAGGNRVAFSGRVGRHALRPSRYRATLTATDPSGNRSKARAVAFRIVRH
jgi:uncharacterized delta-60 repeat protein